MPSTIRHKRNGTPGAIPGAAALVTGELAVNTADGRVFTKTESGTVREVTRQAASSTADRIQRSTSTGSLADSDSLKFDAATGTLSVNVLDLSGSGASRGMILNGNPSVPLTISHSSFGPVVLGDEQEANNATIVKVNDSNSTIEIRAVQTYLSGGTAYVSNLVLPGYLFGSGQLEMKDAMGANGLTLKAANSMSAGVTFTFPATAGSNDQVLTTNGSGALSWTSKGGFARVTQDYAASGTTSYTIPSGATKLRITCIGGGGGGGGGMCNATLNHRGGGGGGGGAGISVMEWNVSDIGTAGSTVLSITVGSGGSGGAGYATNLTWGDDGVSGNETIVSRNSDGLVLCRAAGGRRGGGGGSSTSGTAGGVTLDPFTFGGGSGGAGNYTSNAGTGTQSNQGPSGGGGGGGVSNTGSGQKAGADAFRTSRMLSTTLVAAGGAAVATGTAGNGANAVDFLPGAPGGGGGGGGGANDGKGGNGGNGLRGGGGGGGGAGAAPGGAGSGGSGGTGFVRLEFT